MSNNAPVLTAKSRNDIDGFQVAMMISSIIMDIDVENKLRSYDMHIDDIDTMRLSDLYAFLKSGMAESYIMSLLDFRLHCYILRHQREVI